MPKKRGTLTLFQVTLPYACYGILVNEDTNRIVFAPPIAKWMEDKHLEIILEWVTSKNGTVNNLHV